MLKTEKLQIQGIPAVIYGGASENVWLYVHGKQSAKEAAGRFAETVCAKGWQVLSADLPEHGERSGGPVPLDPWHAVPELREIFDWASRRWERKALRCTSLGTWFSLLALEGDTGGSAVIRRHEELLLLLETSAEELMDVDTPEQLPDRDRCKKA